MVEAAEPGTPWLARCPGCGYDLTGTDLDASPCPECAWVLDARERAWLAARDRFDRRSWIGSVLGGMACLGLTLGALLAIWSVEVAPSFASRVSLAVGAVMGFAFMGGMAASIAFARVERMRARHVWFRSVVWIALPIPLLVLGLLLGRSIAEGFPGVALLLGFPATVWPLALPLVALMCLGFWEGRVRGLARVAFVGAPRGMVAIHVIGIVALLLPLVIAILSL